MYQIRIYNVDHIAGFATHYMELACNVHRTLQLFSIQPTSDLSVFNLAEKDALVAIKLLKTAINVILIIISWLSKMESIKDA